MGKFEEVAGRKRAHVEKMQGIIAEAGGYDVLDFSKVTSLDGDEKAKLEKWQQMVKELNDLEDEYQKERAVTDSAQLVKTMHEDLNAPANRLGPGAVASKGGMAITPSGLVVPAKSLGEQFTETEAYRNADLGSKQLKISTEVEGSIESKTLLTTSAGWAVTTPQPRFDLPTPTRRLVIADLMPNQSISVPMATWMEETTFTNNAAVVAEGATKPESALAWTRREATAKKIANSLPVTTEQLEDIPQIQGIINRRLTLMVQMAEEDELLNGDGTGAHLLGLTQMPNILTQARGSDNNVDAIFKLFTQIRSTGTNTAYAEPSGVVVHPTNWQTIRLMKTTTNEYIWGPPSESGEDRVWGKPTVVTPAITVNTALTGDFRGYAQLDRYKQIRIEVGWVNTQFIENEKTILAEERIILEVYKQQAFGLATGLN